MQEELSKRAKASFLLRESAAIAGFGLFSLDANAHLP